MGVGGKQKDNTDRRRIRKGSERTAQKREGRLMRRRRGETSKSHNNGLEERERESIAGIKQQLQICFNICFNLFRDD